MNHDEATALLKQHVSNKNLLKHMYACEAIMGALAEYFGEDAEAWRLAGLLHDIDYDSLGDNHEGHGLIGAKILAENNVDESIIYAVKCHVASLGFAPKTLMDKALFCTDPTSGFIVAGALIKPEKKLSAIDVPFLLKRFNEKSFAKGANRAQIDACQALGLSREEFLTIALSAMQKEHQLLGL